MSIASTGLSREERTGGRSGGSSRTRMDPLAVSILEAARLTSLCRSTIYELLKEGKLRSIKVGGRHLVDYGSIKELMRTGDAE
jgi:excisionase family DNA binding protein